MRKAVEVWVGSVVVYVAMAACSGGGHVADRGKIEASAGESVVALGGAPDAAASGSPSGTVGRQAGAPGMSAGGLMDPVPSAVAQEGGATGVGPAPALTYTQHVVKCDQLIKVANTNYPAAVLQIDPPSLLTAGRVISVVANASVVGWLQAGVGGMVKPDGSAVGGLCAKDTDTVTFLVPDN